MTHAFNGYFRYLFIVVLMSCSGCASVVASAAPDTITLTPERVARDVYYVRGESGQATTGNRGFTSNAGFVVTSDGVVVFDALGTPVLGKALLTAIGKITTQPVRYVILSHYHADHVYGLQPFKAAKAEIWARSEGQIYLHSDIARERLAERRKSLAAWIGTDTEVLPADRWLPLDAGQTSNFSLGETEFTLVSAGEAHARDDMMLFVRNQSVLFAGDLFYSGRLPFVVDANTKGWLKAIASMKALGAERVVPGHGPVSMDVERDLATTENYIAFLRSKMEIAVSDMRSFDEAYRDIDWTPFENLPTFEAANRRNAYSVYLEMQTELLAGPPGERNE